jgi:hypothetical protein
MDWIGPLFNGLTAFLLNAPVAATLSAVGFVLLALAGALIYFAISNGAGLTTSMRVLLFCCLIGGILFSAAGPGFAVIRGAPAVIEQITKQDAFERLKQNARVRWLIRLVTYNDADSEKLAVGKLDKLGPSKQLFSFVDDYEELAGYELRDAIEMTGTSYRAGKHTSAVLFPIPDEQNLYPANARGVLQVILEVERSRDIGIQKPFLEGQSLLLKEELADLEHLDIPTYRIENFRDQYRHYCQLAEQFRCDKSYSAHAYIGDLANDWHPLGFARRNPDDSSCRPAAVESACEFSDWNTVQKTLLPSFGRRVFLIRNLSVQEIAARVMIDYPDRANRIVPFIGLKKEAGAN